MTPITWLPVSQVAARLKITVEQVEALSLRGQLARAWVHDHHAIAEISVDAYLRKLVGIASEYPGLTVDAAAEHAPQEELAAEGAPIPVRQGPRIGREAEDEYERERET